MREEDRGMEREDSEKKDSERINRIE